MRVGLCFRHFSSWSQQLPHGGMQQECQRQLPGIRESLCGNRRGWRREQVKEVWQWIAHFSRCPAHITEQVSSRARVKSLKHGNVHQGAREGGGKKTLLASRPVSLRVPPPSGVRSTVQMINWSTGGATDWHAYTSRAQTCLQQLTGSCELIAGSELVRQQLASRCNSIHSSLVRSSWRRILI